MFNWRKKYLSLCFILFLPSISGVTIILSFICKMKQNLFRRENTTDIKQVYNSQMQNKYDFNIITIVLWN